MTTGSWFHFFVSADAYETFMFDTHNKYIATNSTEGSETTQAQAHTGALVSGAVSSERSHPGTLVSLMLLSMSRCLHVLNIVIV